MKIFSLLVLFILISCGKDATGVKRLTASQLGGKPGTLTVPKPGVYGGAIAILYNGKTYYSGLNSAAADSYLNGLYLGNVGVIPASQDNLSKKYRVVFEGNFVVGNCPTNPTAQCPLVNLEWIQAY